MCYWIEIELGVLILFFKGLECMFWIFVINFLNILKLVDCVVLIGGESIVLLLWIFLNKGEINFFDVFYFL